METKEMDAFFRRMEAEEQAKKQELLDSIKQAQDRLAKKDETIKELQFERDLIFGNFLNIINERLRLSPFNIFYGFKEEIFWKAWRWSHYKEAVKAELEKGEITEDEYKNHKTCFELTTRTVKEKFFGDLKDKVKFKEIIRNWTVGYDFTYTYKKQEITIFVPTFYADEKTYEYVLNGYRANYKESEYVQGYICSGLDYKEVAKKLQEWLLAERWKKDGK